MNNKVHYSIVGGFVLMSLILIVVFVYWLIQPEKEEVMRPYKIFFTESVSGLNIDSPVKFRGISVGKVQQMMINPENSEEIQVNILIRDDTPIKTDTVAKLEAQGITGLSFIDLSQGSKEAPLLEPEDGEHVAVIPSIPSFFERVGKSLGAVSSQLSQTLERTEQLLNEENQERVAKILDRTAATMGQFEKAFSDRAIADFHQLLASASSASQKIDRLVPQVDRLVPKIEHVMDETVAFEGSVQESLGSIAQSYLAMQELMVILKQKVESGHYSVKDSVHAPMKQFEITMRELEQTMNKLNAMIEAYDNSPSDILFKHEEPNIGPGEK